MINFNINNQEEFNRKVSGVTKALREMIEEKLLRELAEKSITNITSGIERQRAIDGSILKQNSAATVAKKLGYTKERQQVFGDKKKFNIKISKTAKSSLGGAISVRALIDRGILFRPSTYQVTRVGKSQWEVSIRAVKSADPDDNVTRDKVAPFLEKMGYRFFGIGKNINENVQKIMDVELRKLGLK